MISSSKDLDENKHCMQGKKKATTIMMNYLCIGSLSKTLNCKKI